MRLLNEEETSDAKADAILLWVNSHQDTTPREVAEFINSDESKQVIDKFIFQAQDTKTLKAVAEWLESKGHLERDEGSGDWYWEFDFILRYKVFDQLKQGKMPDE